MRQNNRSGLHEKGALNVQAYVDVKKVATIAAFLSDTGELYAPQYGVISQYCINYFMAILEEHYPQHLTRFNNTSDAIHWLDEHRFSMAQFKPEGNRRISRTLAYESESAREFGADTYGAHKVLKSSIGVPSQGDLSPHGQEKLVPLHEQVQMAKTLHRDHGIIAAGFEYLFDPSIPNPHLTQEQIADRKQAVAVVEKNMEEWMQVQDRPAPNKEQVEANLRQSAITLMLKNSTSAQQMPIPKELVRFLTDVSVLEEVERLRQPYIEQREKDMLAAEEEKKKRLEETARRQVGA